MLLFGVKLGGLKYFLLFVVLFGRIKYEVRNKFMYSLW